MNKKDPDERFYNELLLNGINPEDIVWEDNFGKVLRRYQVPREKLDRNPRDPKDRAFGCIGDDKRKRVPSCHYTDQRYKHAQTVFGRSVEGKKGYGYDYSDRFKNWNWDLWEEGMGRAREYLHLPQCDWEDRSCMFWEMVLGYYYQRVTLTVDETMTQSTLKVNVCIGHILTGFNWSNGHTYEVFGYKLMGKDKNKIPR